MIDKCNVFDAYLSQFVTPGKSPDGMIHRYKLISVGNLKFITHTTTS